MRLTLAAAVTLLLGATLVGCGEGKPALCSSVDDYRRRSNITNEFAALISLWLDAGHAAVSVLTWYSKAQDVADNDRNDSHQHVDDLGSRRTASTAASA